MWGKEALNPEVGGAAGGDASSGGTGGENASSGGASSGGSAAGGAEGTGGGPQYVCNQVTGFTVTSEWYLAGFETGVEDSRWQLKWQSGSYVEKWADPNSEPWSAEIVSPCSAGSTSPDRVVWVVLSWSVYSQQQWETLITDALETFDIKYPNVKRYDLLTIVRGPNNQACGASSSGESVAIPAKLDAAIAAVAGRSSGRVVQGPQFEASDCASTFDGAGPHLISPGVEALATTISQHFADLQ